mmetsp:Transcript_32739/g.104332  ORF Transcript_32739/g.104332 Transcript_32739/m.104332 type:complete len:245 (-) Transcript_32739:7-741(-)
MAPISMSSVTTTPSNPSSFRRYAMAPLLMVAGSPLSSPAPESSAAVATCATMTAATPALTTSLKGGISTSWSLLREWRITGRLRCESTSVSPCPGQCFTHAATPCPWMPPTIATPMRPTTAASREKDRSAITGLSGFVSTSTTGARSISMWTSRSSLPSTRPAACAAPSGSAALPRLRADGMTEKGGPRRATRPPSWSMAMRKGALASRLRSAHRPATCLGSFTLRLNNIAPPNPGCMVRARGG